GLTNDKAYYFKINSVDLNGNTSDFSEVVGATPSLYIQSSGLTGTFTPDFDNNGFNDILSSNGSNYELYKNNVGTFLKSGFNLPALYGGSLSFADYNNDGYYDIFFSGGNTDDNAFSRLFKNVSGNFEDINANITGVVVSSIDWTDYDNDGDLDFILTGDPTDPYIVAEDGVNPQLPRVRITKLYRNDGNGVFTEVNSDFPGILLGSAVWGDYDNDGDQDLLLCGLDFIKIYENVKGSFREVIDYKGYDNKGAWGDFNNDGLLDFCVVSADTFIYQNNSHLKIFYNNGYKSFNLVTIASSLYYWDVTCRDYDDDGDLDIIFLNGNVVYQNNGDNNFKRISLPSALSFADYDNDGDLDIMGQSGIYRNNKVFNQNFNIKKNINPPLNLHTTFLHDHSVKFSWSKPGNNTSQILTYNIRLGTKPNGINIVSPMSNLVTGKRLKPAIGNAGFDTSWTIKNLPEGTYYWSIQSVDNNFDASVFSTEQKITVSYSFIAPHLVAVSGNELIQLKWNKYEFNDFKMYNIYETNLKKDSLLCSIKNINDTSLFIDGLKNGQQYYFKINSIDLNNDTSSFSEIVEVTPNLYKKLSDSIGLFTPDVDNNGFNDLLLLEGKIPDLKYSLYKNDSGLFLKTGFDFPQLNEGSISWADYNNDGLYDLIYSGLSNDGNKYTRILKNTNTNFNDINAAIMGIDFSSIDWADYDNDGDLDFILTGSNNDPDNGVTKLYRNDGNNIFTEMNIDFAGVLKGSVSWGDFDNDGDQDL
ncbi:MAG: FG-GAP-like repeat-containing protein, partial [Ignavibacteriaceae bacterium]